MSETVSDETPGSDDGGGRYRAGRMVARRYRLERELGRGGMGVVWEAHDISLDRQVAVKGLLRTFDGDEEQARWLSRARSEARALAKVRHENVVAVHDFIEDGGDIGIVMELVDGRTVADLLRGPHSQLAVPHAARIALQVLHGLRAAHAVGVMHRDVKPSNIVYRPDGRALLMDFGIAVMPDVTRVTLPHEQVGSVAYMAPELVKRGPADAPSPSVASDLWSLGVTLYEMVEGRLPFEGNGFGVVYAIQEEDPPPPLFAGPLTGLIGQLLAKNPEDRPAPDTVERILRDVAEHRAAETAPGSPSLPGTPGASGPAGPPGAPAPPRWKIPAVALGTALALAAGVLTWRHFDGTAPSDTTSRKPPTLSAEELAKELAGHDGVLQIGVKATQPGLSQLEKGLYEGFEPDLAREIARELGFEEEGQDFEFRTVTSENRDDKLQPDIPGHVEMVLATYSINATNQKEAEFAGHYMSTLGAVLVRSKGRRDFRDLGELRAADPQDTHVCTASGSKTYIELLKEEHLGPHTETRETYEGCVQALLDDTSKVYGVVTDEAILRGLHSKREDSTKVLSFPGDHQKYGVALAKGRTDLRRGVCEAVRRVLTRAPGHPRSWWKLYDRHLKDLMGGESSSPPPTPCPQA